jgi:hypothetical protein
MKERNFRENYITTGSLAVVMFFLTCLFRAFASQASLSSLFYYVSKFLQFSMNMFQRFFGLETLFLNYTIFDNLYFQKMMWIQVFT